MKRTPIFPIKEKTNSQKKASGKSAAKEEDMDMMIFKTKAGLIDLEKRLRIILEKELSVARYNRDNGIRKSGNYSRIGIAYYMLNLIDTAKENLDEVSSTHELYKTVNSLGAAIGSINRINGKPDGMNVNSIIKNINKMNSETVAGEKRMAKDLERFEEGTSKNKGIAIDKLVSMDLIEKLINGGCNVADMTVRHEGLLQDTDLFMKKKDLSIKEEESLMHEEASNPDEILNNISMMISALK